MAYDKEARTITTNGDRKQFEGDMLSFMAHVQSDVDAELAQQAKKKTWRHRIESLSRTTRLSIVVFVAWTLFVWARTADSYEVLGFRLRQWDDDYLFVNWLVVPAVIVALVKAFQWALRSKRHRHGYVCE